MHTTAVRVRNIALVMIGTLLGVTPAYAITARQAAAQYGTRPPTVCPRVKAKSGPPPAAIIKPLVKCEYEEKLVGNVLLLMGDVKVQVGAPIPWHSSIMASDADARFPFYPIRGSFVSAMCRRVFPWSHNKGKNCETQRITQDTGLCWHTSFGDWKCGLGGGDLRQDAAVKHQPPPPGIAVR